MKECRSCVFWLPNTITSPSEGELHLCYHPQIQQAVAADYGCERHLSSDSTEMNVPNHASNGTMTDPNPNPVDGPVEVLIVSYWKDFPWLEYALRSIQKRFRGFQGVTIAHPHRDRDLFQSLVGRFGVRLHGYDEVEGKGMVQHMQKMAEADLIVPRDTKYVLHTDSDGIFKMDCTPEHFFWNDKPHWLIRTWASLGVPDRRHPVSKAVSDCGQWKGPTDRQLGWNTEWYTMCLNTQAMPIGFYQPYREHVAKVHNKPFTDYMLAGENSFPQSVMDWTAMGAWAEKFMHDRFTWFDVESGQPYPVDRKKAFWSHGGISPQVREEIEAMLK